MGDHVRPTVGDRVRHRNSGRAGVVRIARPQLDNTCEYLVDIDWPETSSAWWSSIHIEAMEHKARSDRQ